MVSETIYEVGYGARYVNPTTNYFRLTTLVDNVVIESAESTSWI